ncbi:MAG: replicative DNA helicase [Minisyncoccia bacterium]
MIAKQKDDVNEKLPKELPPQNIEAEKSVLGCLMIDKEAITKIADFLEPDDFYKTAHQKIYSAILDLYSKHEPIDIVSVTNRLQAKKQLSEVGGASYLASLINMVPTSSHVVAYAKIVQQKRILRNLISTAYEIGELAWNESKDVEQLLDEAEQKLFQITQKSLRQEFLPLKPMLSKAFERIEMLHQGEKQFSGIPTGFIELDKKLFGLQPSDLIILAARPSLGKTSFALDIARHAAVKEKKSVGIFSLEMSKEQVVDRLISAESGIELWRIRTGKLQPEDFEILQQGLDRLSQAPIYIDDNSSPNIMQIRTMARRLQAEKGLDLIIIDYLQLIVPRENYNGSMVQQITEISRGLKALARELNVPILAVSQLSRAVEQRDHKIPKLSDLRESGSIEQDADVVLFIYRKDRDKLEAELTEEEKNTAEIIIAKHRNGPLGTVKVKFIPELTTFRNIDETFSEEGLVDVEGDWSFVE